MYKVDANKLFKSACQKGYFDLTMWLKRMFPKIDPHMDGNWCYNNTTNPEILAWLNQDCRFQNVKSARK